MAQELYERGERPQAIVDVIVPVYRGYVDTLACIYSVLAGKNITPHELIVIDDVSPEPELSSALRLLAEMGLIKLLVNPTNRGFVSTVNRGMKVHPGRDVVLLNSDTEVYGDWLDRLAAHAMGNVATVTPFSNNATICSYPRFNQDNPSLLEVSYGDLDRMAAEVNAGQSIDIPTAIGFCMFIRRAALDDVGYFDEAAFGKGYGEENDFCMRAAERDWRNVLAADVFVRHTGQTSFAGAASESQRRGLQVLAKRYPGYQKIIAEHITRDPARHLRRALDLARMRRVTDERPSVAAFSHTWGGGIQRHIAEEERRLAALGFAQVVVTPTELNSTQANVNVVDPVDLPNLAGLEFGAGRPELASVLAALKAAKIAMHSLVGWHPQIVHELPELARHLGVPFECTLHDYVPICPQINLVNGTGKYCGELGEKHCAECISNAPPKSIHGPRPFGAAPRIDTWRHAYAQMLSRADVVFAPSQDTAARFWRYFPDLSIEAKPHISDLSVPPRLAVLYEGGLLRVLVIGAIGTAKGSQVLRACAQDAKTRRLPLEFKIVGFTNNNNELLQIGNVTITGRYRDEELVSIIGKQKAHIAFLPSVWPETYCYTLSAAMGAGFPTVIFDIGAQSERLPATLGLKLPIELADQPGRINDHLIGFASRDLNV